MSTNKPITKAKAKRAIRKVKLKENTDTAKKRTGGNIHAPKWTPAKIDELNKKMLKSVQSPTCWSLCQVANEVGMLVTNLLDIVKRYPAASEAYSLVKQILSARYSTLGANGGGNSNYVMKMIPYYNKLLYNFDLELLRAQEAIKTDSKLREHREKGVNVDEGNGSVLDEFDEFLKWKALKPQRN